MRVTKIVVYLVLCHVMLELRRHEDVSETALLVLLPSRCSVGWGQLFSSQLLLSTSAVRNKRAEAANAVCSRAMWQASGHAELPMTLHKWPERGRSVLCSTYVRLSV